MKQHQYKVTLEHLADYEGNAVEPKKIEFSAPNHDDIFAIIDKVKQREGFDEQMAQRFAVGLKLFSEVVMENRKNPLFEQLTPHLREMMKVIKGKNS